MNTAVHKHDDSSNKNIAPASNNTFCVYHQKPGHKIFECVAFKKISYKDKQKIFIT